MIIDYKEIRQMHIASQAVIGILKSIDGVESVVANTVNLRDMTINYYITTKDICAKGVQKIYSTVDVVDKFKSGSEWGWVAKKSYV